jgi:DNA-binding transcriptional MerR regulator/methylmalonyl-CoA mutase cobalamin-binding subunit
MTATGARARYPIRAVSKLTGISIDTLRAWERRYSVVVPVRDERGRMYTDGDVTRLRLVHQAVLAGHSVGRIASLSDPELQQLATPRAAAPDDPVARAVIDTSALRDALLTLDSADVDREASRLAAMLSPVELIRDALLPLLREVGDHWNARRDGIAVEHMMSSTLRHLFGSFLRFYGRRADAVRLLFATPTGDHHEIGILAAAMLAAGHGCAVSYVGPNVPARDLLAAVEAARARVLVLGLTFTRSATARQRDLRAIGRDLRPDVELWMGGRDAEGCAGLVGPRAVVLRDFDGYLTELGRLGDRAR